MSCRAQVDAMAARTELTLPSPEILERAAHLTNRQHADLTACWRHAMLRLLEAEQRSSGFPPYWS
jgi:hypothetical protein